MKSKLSVNRAPRESRPKVKSKLSVNRATRQSRMGLVMREFLGLLLEDLM